MSPFWNGSKAQLILSILAATLLPDFVSSFFDESREFHTGKNVALKHFIYQSRKATLAAGNHLTSIVTLGHVRSSNLFKTNRFALR